MFLIWNIDLFNRVYTRKARTPKAGPRDPYGGTPGP